RAHRPQTYERWAASTPARFRFAVKLPKQISHEARLADEIHGTGLAHPREKPPRNLRVEC
ncbi:MAG: DUF72 domain-containing protein, partial [Rubrivivax sp.]